MSYNSIFTTRSLMPELSSAIPSTALPTFSHEGDLNFTWGFYRDFDLTVLVPSSPIALTTAGTHHRWRNRPRRRDGAGEVPLLPAGFAREEPHRLRHCRSEGSDRITGLTEQMESLCRRVCSRVPAPPICSWRRIGLIPAFSISSDLWLMKISIRLSAPRNAGDTSRKQHRIALLAFVPAIRIQERSSRMVHRPCADLAVLTR